MSDQAPGVRFKKKIDQRIFFQPALWDALAKAAEFYDQAYKLAGTDESISRNRLMEDWLESALAVFWESQGGEPPSDSGQQWDAAVKRFAGEVKKQLMDRKQKSKKQSD